MEEFIVGRNAVREALRSRRPFNKVLVQEGSHGGSLSEILELAQEQKIPVEKSPGKCWTVWLTASAIRGWRPRGLL